MENIGPIPGKFQAIVSSILFYLNISRNHYAKLAPQAPEFQPARSKDAVSALLLLRDQALEYPLRLPANRTLDAWEKAIETHARAGALEPKELRLCLYFLCLLDRPALLGMLHSLSVAAGEELNNESVATVVRCYLRHRWFAQARRFIWQNNLNNISFARFSFLIDRAEKGAAPVPESDDKFLRFLRYRFGSNLPAKTTTSSPENS